jgi:hypothetical protein
VFSPEPAETFLGVRVLPIVEHSTVTYDVLVVAVLERPAGTAKLLRQCGVPDEKVLMLRPDWPSPAAASSNGAQEPRD